MTDVTDNLDLSAQAGILLGAFATGRSFQPNLLSRATKDRRSCPGRRRPATGGAPPGIRCCGRSPAGQAEVAWEPVR